MSFQFTIKAGVGGLDIADLQDKRENITFSGEAYDPCAIKSISFYKD